MPADRPAKGRKLFLAFVGLAGLALIATSVHVGFRQYAIMTRWPRTDALVISSQLDHKLTTGNSNAYMITVYWPAVTLQYTVGGKQYVVPAAYAASSSIRSNWEPVVAELKPGTHHLLPYDPSDPTHIYVGLKWNFATLALAGFLMLPGVVLVLLALLGSVSRPKSVQTT